VAVDVISLVRVASFAEQLTGARYNANFRLSVTPMSFEPKGHEDRPKEHYDKEDQSRQMLPAHDTSREHQSQNRGECVGANGQVAPLPLRWLRRHRTQYEGEASREGVEHSVTGQ
jgi:hypothetical protein